MRAAALVVALAAAVAAGCGGDDGEPLETGAAVPGFAFAESDVADGEPIDSRFTCDGENVSPALAWEGVPEDTAELGLVVEDPDAPGGLFTHWLAYGLDPGTTELPAGVPAGRPVDGGLVLLQGVNDLGEDAYGGPCPPGGEEHRYVFRLLALDAPTGLDGGASREELLAAVEGHVIGEARLTATYARP
jgi:Raf kinase inhibitor-like YbhB/YbcL family protein